MYFYIFIYMFNSTELMMSTIGESIRPADPVVFDRIRIGFHRNPTFFIKKTDRIRQTFCRVPFSRIPTRISSEFDGTRWNPGRIWSDFNHVPSNSDKIRVGIRLKRIRQKFCRIRSKFFRSDGIRSPSVTWEAILFRKQKMP